MTGKEIIEQSKKVTAELVSQLSNKEIPQNKRQVYFMDNHAKIQGCMKALNAVVKEIKESELTSAEDLDIMEEAENILGELQSTIVTFQKELMINENISDEDIDKIPGLTAESIQQAAQDNDTTKDIIQDMNNIAKNSPANIGYTHCLVCDGTMNMFTANTKEELNKNINDIASAGNYKQFNLFRVSFIPVPLKKKTILTA